MDTTNNRDNADWNRDTRNENREGYNAAGRESENSRAEDSWQNASSREGSEDRDETDDTMRAGSQSRENMSDTSQSYNQQASWSNREEDESADSRYNAQGRESDNEDRSGNRDEKRQNLSGRENFDTEDPGSRM